MPQTARTIPVVTRFRTEHSRRKAAAKIRDEGWWGFEIASVVDIALNSKRRNTKSIRPDAVEAVHYDAGQKIIVTLADGRVVCMRVRFSALCATVSHDLEHLWWYGLTQQDREDFAPPAAVWKPKKKVSK